MLANGSIKQKSYILLTDNVKQKNPLIIKYKCKKYKKDALLKYKTNGKKLVQTPEEAFFGLTSFLNCGNVFTKKYLKFANQRLAFDSKYLLKLGDVQNDLCKLVSRHDISNSSIIYFSKLDKVSSIYFEKDSNGWFRKTNSLNKYNYLSTLIFLNECNGLKEYPTIHANKIVLNIDNEFLISFNGTILKSAINLDNLKKLKSSKIKSAEVIRKIIQLNKERKFPEISDHFLDSNNQIAKDSFVKSIENPMVPIRSIFSSKKTYILGEIYIHDVTITALQKEGHKFIYYIFSKIVNNKRKVGIDKIFNCKSETALICYFVQGSYFRELLNKKLFKI